MLLDKASRIVNTFITFVPGRDCQTSSVTCHVFQRLISVTKGTYEKSLIPYFRENMKVLSKSPMGIYTQKLAAKYWILCQPLSTLVTKWMLTLGWYWAISSLVLLNVQCFLLYIEGLGDESSSSILYYILFSWIHGVKASCGVVCAKYIVVKRWHVDSISTEPYGLFSQLQKYKEHFRAKN